MKIFRKYIPLLITLGLSFAFVFGNFFAPRALAAGSSGDPNCRYLLGMVSWDCHVNFEPNNQDDLTQDAITIAANIFTDLTVAAAYLVLGYTIYGGYLYIMSSGDPARALAGKRTLTHAFTGLAIVLSANIILNTIRIALLGASGSFECNPLQTSCIDPSLLVSNVINWIIGVAGVVALGFIFLGGIGYLTSAGDAGKLQKAKSTILYAAIGLIIVGLSFVITAFVTNLIQNANQNAWLITNSQEMII